MVFIGKKRGFRAWRSNSFSIPFSVSAIALISNIILCCTCKPGFKDTDVHPLSAFTPKDNEEAEYIALYLSGELLAPEELYQGVLLELSLLRGLFKDDFQVVDVISFWPPWQAGAVAVYFDEETKPMVADGTFSGWNKLNEKYDLSSMRLDFLDPFDFAILYFNGRLHPDVLSHDYASLPGVRHTSTYNENVLSANNSNLYPGWSSEHPAYLFDHCWNEGIDRHYIYFRSEQGQPRLIGDWLRLGSCLSEHNEECYQLCLDRCIEDGLAVCEDRCSASWSDHCDDFCPGYNEEPVWWEEARLHKEQYSR